MGIEAALIGAGAGLLGSAMSSRSANKAVDAQSAATDAAIEEQRRQYDQTRADLAPYRQVGGNALQQLYGGINQQVTPEMVMSDPGYQFGMDQGMQALQRAQSRMGGRVSGQALKSAARFGTGFASQGYNAAYQRRQDTLNRLAAIAGIGQTATGSSAAAGSQMANNVSGLMSGQGNASAAARMAQGNIWGNAFGDLGAQLSRRQMPVPGQSFGSNLDSFFTGTGGSGD
jgi:hypothetical protein